MTAQLDLTYLTEVRESASITPIDAQRDSDDGKYKETAFDHLVLETGHKDMIVSLITQHFRDKEAKGAQMEQVDIVRGKGAFFAYITCFSPFSVFHLESLFD